MLISYGCEQALLGIKLSACSPVLTVTTSQIALNRQ